MNKKTSNPNFIVTILIAFLFYKIAVTSSDYIGFFKTKETMASMKARMIINSVNNTKFNFAGPAKWEKLSRYKDSCIEDNGKINWAIVGVFLVTPSWVKLTRPSGIPQMNFSNEDAFFYYFTDGIIPRHLLKTFLNFKAYDKVYLAWKNIILDQSDKDSQYKDILCSEVIHEVRLATPQEIEEYSKIEPELLVSTPR